MSETAAVSSTPSEGDTPSRSQQLDTEAGKQLRRARKLLASNDFEPNAEAEYLVESAKVLGMLSLAEAIRDLKR